MYTSKEEIFKYLDNLNIKYKRIDHKAVFTMEEMSKLNLEDESEVVKNLFIRDDKAIEYDPAFKLWCVFTKKSHPEKSCKSMFMECDFDMNIIS